MNADLFSVAEFGEGKPHFARQIFRLLIATVVTVSIAIVFVIQVLLPGFPGVWNSPHMWQVMLSVPLHSVLSVPLVDLLDGVR